MKITIRGRRAYLYRRRWVPAGGGVPHGYPVDDYVCSMDAAATEVPETLRLALTAAEVTKVEQMVCLPAREAIARQRARELEPGWRIDEAARLLSEAADLSCQRLVPKARLAGIHDSLSRIRVLEGVSTRPVSAERVDTLAEALAALKAAAKAVEDGAYGFAPAEGVRSTRVYRLWSELLAAVEGDRGSLLRALQDKGYAKRKGMN